MTAAPWLCRLMGHRPRFRVDGATMYWECERGCGQASDSKTYATAEQARRYAAAFDRRDNSELGKRAPLIGLLPLRVWRRLNGPSTSRTRSPRRL
ncbi:hypothetical protein BST37_07670 [Mycobacterium noviomagense]|uniref:Integrase n=1 Tax=Mycobacterium noviomagense TaxID=459858 RepID=A0ABX3T7H6_9MYCO|nr:hypothetical protein BST37_07670 [Mycobacterium noviomagense]